MEKARAARQKRLDNLDLMKALGILMVLSLHVPLWDFDFIAVPSLARAAQYALRIASEGVPLFVMVNGFLLFRKRGFDLKAHLKKCLRLFALLIAWSVILTVAGMLLEREPRAVTLRDVLYHTAWLQVGSQYNGVLWFLQSLLAVYLVFPVLRKLYEDSFTLFRYLFWVVAAFTVGINLLELIRDYANSFGDATLLTDFINFFYRFSPLGNAWYLFYFLLGGMVYARGEWIRRHRAAIVVAGLASWPVAFAYGYTLSLRFGWVHNPAFNYGSIFMVFFLVGLFALTLNYRNNGSPVCRFVAGVGGNTFGIYLCHFLFIFAVYRFFDLNTGWRRAAAFAAVFLLSHGFSMLAKKVPVLRELFNL